MSVFRRSVTSSQRDPDLDVSLEWPDAEDDAVTRDDHEPGLHDDQDGSGSASHGATRNGSGSGGGATTLRVRLRSTDGAPDGQPTRGRTVIDDLVDQIDELRATVDVLTERIERLER